MNAFIDVALFALVIVYLFFVTLSGIVKIGIRILWVTLFRLKRRASPPQGLMLASIILVLSLLALTNVLLAVAPQYTSYGGQVYTAMRDGAPQTVPCSASAPPSANCQLSQIATFSTLISLNLPFFGVVFYWATWGFLGTTLLSCFWAIIRVSVCC